MGKVKKQKGLLDGRNRTSTGPIPLGKGTSKFGWSSIGKCLFKRVVEITEWPCPRERSGLRSGPQAERHAEGLFDRRQLILTERLDSGV